ncbi:hypothetical protein JW905_01210 [bacterium]|nr:hypothetical protein [candidate division CSSED10-310 bacterium]
MKKGMKKAAGLVLLSMSMVIPSHADREVAVHRLENDLAAYSFSVGASSICLDSIEDKHTGTEYLFGGELWRLTFYSPSLQHTLRLDNLQNAAACQAWWQDLPAEDVELLGLSGEVDDRCLFLEWTQPLSSYHPEPLQLSIMVRVTLSQGTDISPRACWRIWVDNQLDYQDLDWVLVEVTFPRLRFMTTPREGHDYLAFSREVGQLIRDPAESILQPFEVGYSNNNGRASMQFNAYYRESTGAGLYFATLDSLSRQKTFTFAADPMLPSLRCETTHTAQNAMSPLSMAPHRWNPGNDYQHAGMVHVVGPFMGDWYDAAEIYRHWALNQSWTRYGRVIQRDDPGQPGYLQEFLREGEFLTLYFSPQVEEFEFDTELLPAYLEHYRDYLGLTDVIFMIWPWWWNRDMFQEMAGSPWPPSSPLWYYYFNWPEYTGGGDFVGDNQPEKLRRRFPELLDELHQIEGLNVHTTVAPAGAFSIPFDRFLFDWTTYQSKSLQGWRSGFLCTGSHAAQDYLAAMLGDWETYLNGQLDGVYMGYGFYNLPCYDPTHEHFNEHGEAGGWSGYAAAIERFTEVMKAATLGDDFLVLSEGLNEASCSAADLVFVYHLDGAENTLGSPDATFDGNNLFTVPMFQTVYNDYIINSGMLYPFPGIYYHNEYFDGSYVTPSRESDCAGATFDYFPLDDATASYPSYDAMIGMQYMIGARINIADVDQAADENGAAIENGRFLERDSGLPGAPLGKSRTFLKRLLQSQRNYGLDAAQPARRYMVLGRMMRPPDITNSGMTPGATDTLIQFDDFFYSHCVLMLPLAGGDPHSAYIHSLRVHNVLRGAWRLPEADSTLIALTNWTSFDQAVDLSFDPVAYGIPFYSPSFLAEIGADGIIPSSIIAFSSNPGTVTIPAAQVNKRQAKMFILYPGQPPADLAQPSPHHRVADPWQTPPSLIK